MGRFFKKVRKAVLAHAQIAGMALNAALATVLAAKMDLADDIKKGLEEVLEALERDEYDTEDMVHNALQNVFKKLIDDQPLFVQAAIADMLNTISTVLLQEIGGLDEDVILSEEEKKAYKDIIKRMLRTVELALKEQERK